MLLRLHGVEARVPQVGLIEPAALCGDRVSEDGGVVQRRAEAPIGPPQSHVLFVADALDACTIGGLEALLPRLPGSGDRVIAKMLAVDDAFVLETIAHFRVHAGEHLPAVGNVRLTAVPRGKQAAEEHVLGPSVRVRELVVKTDLHLPWKLGGRVNAIADGAARRVAAHVARELGPKPGRDLAEPLRRVDAEPAQQHRRVPAQPAFQFRAVPGNPVRERLRRSGHLAAGLHEPRHRRVVARIPPVHGSATRPFEPVKRTASPRPAHQGRSTNCLASAP